ncbi:LacI family DNA-binding transcriptional regulator [Candidatus Peregrinibacteria bacterium]|nr:LacI family DNA-binding transcriptional regulator [Candidatus Peregrinibacteria bacterium]
MERITQKDIARLSGLDQGSVSRILRGDDRDSFSKDIAERVFKIAREQGYIHPSVTSLNKREMPRKKAGLMADIKVVGSNGKVFDEGTAQVQSISLSGMLLKGIKTKKMMLPINYFTMEIRPKHIFFKDFKASASIARFVKSDEGLAMAVAYTSISFENRDKIKKFLQK